MLQFKYLFQLSSVALTVGMCLNVTSVYAVSITIGGIAINDNGMRDLNQAADIIAFDSTSAGAAGFVIPGFTTSGIVDLGAGGAVVGVGQRFIVRLTDFDLVRTAAGAGNVRISFDHTFAMPPAPVTAADGIQGSFGNVLVGGAAGAGGNSVSWQGFVNNVAITPPMGAFISAPNPLTGRFSGGHGPMMIGAGGPPWTLRGDLEVALGRRAGSFSLPDSAEVGISTSLIEPPPTDQTPVPEPITLFGTGTALCFGLFFKQELFKKQKKQKANI
ncbi:PEP-CTERM sorting domain-containing protein [Nostoc sp. CHAB 5844]|nr:PEP-CTERM sorting domain-containing protein [Nostoc sp. CHAB 5844]